MSSAVLPPPPPAFKNRRGWAIAFGVAEILIGCLVLLCIALVGVATRMAPPTPSTPPPDARFFIAAAVFYGAVSCFFIVVGIGNVQVKRWARTVMLCVSWAWLALGVLATVLLAVGYRLFMAMAQQGSAKELPQNFGTILAIVMSVILGFFFILLPLVFVLFYSGRNVKATYQNATGLTASAVSHKPIPVLIATAWFALGILGCLWIFAMPVLPMFGVILRGWQAVLVGMLLGVFNVWLAVNIYRQRPLAWKLTFPMIAFGWASMWVTMYRMGLDGMYRAMGYSDPQTAQMAPFMRYVLLFSALVAVAFVVLLIASRKHYLGTPAQT